jgi:hypothetical protein
VAAIRLRCQKCHTRFSKPQGSRRIYCETCSPPRKPPVAMRDVDQGASEGVGPIEARMLLDLEAVDRAETVEGLLVLNLARDIDSGRVAPAQKGIAGQRLLVLLGRALEGTKIPEPDRLDELSARRASREAS